jgi:hypothetical protein
MFVARFTVEFIRSVPVVPLAVTARVIRPGRRIQLLEAALTAGSDLVARAAALRIRRHPGLDLPARAGGPDDSLPPPEAATPLRLVPVDYENLSDALETRSITGGLTEPGPATGWIRLTVPVVADAAPSPLQRVAVAADCGNGISSAVELGAWLFINPDLTVYQHRDLAGEWVGMDAISRLETHGAGLADTALYDRDGRFGRSLQSLYVDRAEALST